MNKRIRNKIFKRAQHKVRTDKPLTTLEDKVWKLMNSFFLRVVAPIINELMIEESQGREEKWQYQ